jgi:hypothetical protein
VLFEKHRDVADPRDQRRFGGGRQFRQQPIAIVTVGGADADLDEFVIGQGAARFGDHIGTEATLANQNDGFERMGAAAQKAQLCFG